MKKALLILFALLLVFAFTSQVLAYSDYTEYDEQTEYKEDYNIGKSVLISFCIGLVIAGIVCIIMYSQLKSVHFKSNANDYIKSGSMKLSRSQDLYLYSNVTRVPKPKNNSKR